MTLLQIIGAAVIIAFFRQYFWLNVKGWLLFILSLSAVFFFQSPSLIRSLNFWLPNLMLLIAFATWRIISNKRASKQDFVTIFAIIIFPFLMAVLKGLGLSENPLILNIPTIKNLFILSVALILILHFFGNNEENNAPFIYLIIFLLVIFLIILKNQYFSLKISALLRQLNGQSKSLASPLDLTWVGFSYFVFRIIHVLADRKRVMKYCLSFRDFFTYVFFFPAFTSGPIDRIDHFNSELSDSSDDEKENDFYQGFRRIVIGLFQKFILADSLALISLNLYNAQVINASKWMWVVVYAYSFRIYFDFSGYTHIAIGIAQLAGIRLPENFNRPYLSKNITIFWNNWHITVTQWFRSYYFNPLTRFLKVNYKNVSPLLVLIFVQLSTMILIGLWHGISWNFVTWGLWNGIGLFIHNRWSSTLKPGIKIFNEKKFEKAFQLFSTLLTFTYISLGWVWFALPNIKVSLLVFNKLFNL